MWARLAAEDLQHIGTLPRFFARMAELWRYLTHHWLRLVVDDNTRANRSRLPLHPTWKLLQDGFTGAPGIGLLDPERATLVRAARHTGKSRILRRLALGVVKSLEVEDASPTAAALLTLQRWVERVAEMEVARITTKCQRYQETHGSPIPRATQRGMGERFARVEQLEHRVQMLLGIFAAKGVLPLAFKPAHSVGDLVVQHLDELEQEADAKGGVQQVLADHFAQVYKVATPRAFFTAASPAAA
jgi:hypothetical protein